MSNSLTLITYIKCGTDKFLNLVPSYLQNITSLKGFGEAISLTIVRAKSNNTTKEDKIFKPYIESHECINIIDVDDVACQYDAWNIAIQNSTSDYISNTNLDDRRSLDGTYDLLQSVTEEADVFYGWCGLQVRIDHILKNKLIGPNKNYRYPVEQIDTLQDLFRHNSPHCFPMWKRDIHDRAGLFDVSYPSIGDYEIWLRGMKFYNFKFKFVDTYIGDYYYSPEGLSTNHDTREQVANENRRMRVLYGRGIKSEFIEINVAGDGTIKTKKVSVL